MYPLNAYTLCRLFWKFPERNQAQENLNFSALKLISKSLLQTDSIAPQFRRVRQIFYDIQIFS